jgi:hypothetical protein
VLFINSKAVEFLSLMERAPERALAIGAEICRGILDAPKPAVLTSELPVAVELERFVPLPLAADLRNIHKEGLLREEARRVAAGKKRRIIPVSNHRVAMRLKHALLLGDDE